MSTAKSAECKVISVCNQKGGVAKSATAVNLSAALAAKGYRLLLIDADPQGDASNMLGVETEELETTLATLLEKQIKDEDVEPGDGVICDVGGIDLIPSNIELAALEASLVNVMNRERLLQDYVAMQRPFYDFIIIDCLPSLGMITINALAAADSVLIPVQAEKPAAKGMIQLLKSIIKVRKHLNSCLEIEGILPTMVDGRLNYSKDVIASLNDTYGASIHIFDNYIPRRAKMGECAAEGMSIFEYAPKDEAAKAYMKLAEEVADRWLM